MTGKEKILSAFSKEGTTEFPVVICYEGIFIRDHWSELTSYPWYTVHLPDLSSQIACYSEIHSKINQDWFVVYPFYSHEERNSIRVKIFDDSIQIFDTTTGSTRHISKPTVGGWSVSGQIQSVRIEKLPETISELEKILPEKPGKFNKEKFLNEGRHQLAQSLIRLFPEKMPLCHIASPLWKLYGLVGFEGMMTLIATNPELVLYACERFLEISINYVQQEAAIGAQLIWIEECLTDMISPAAFERFNVPFMKRLVNAIRETGAKSIYYYCGNPWDRIDKILQIGADALAFEEGKKGFEIDIEKIADVVAGRAVILGNLDAINLLPHADEKTLAKEIERQMKAGIKNKRRFIMSTGSPVTPETSIAQVQLYCELARKIGAQI
ncbi:MAG: uroporphyrinogen decarboxylase family protein [Candidatus Omnitrophica bacterium]|nr:uroporphyrinogen decarboxylase family protein [Candidatus Omnitrophota bacterium]